MAAVAPVWDPPGEFEEYRIIRPLGAGTMGQVYLAHDTLLDRPVAIKFVGAAEAGAAARERFFTEARAVARLSHPNVVAVHRVGEIRRRPYLVSEYVEGTSLDRVPKPIPWERAVRIAVGLAQGLAAAHRSGVLHRDLKPANVVLGPGDGAKLLDFGLAKLLDAASAPERAPVVAPDAPVDATASLPGRAPLAPETAPHLTAAGALVGTPLYLAPELWRGEPASLRSDVYAFGVLLHELLAGQAPHAGVPVGELAARVAANDVPPIGARVPALPPALAALVDDCVSRDPARRPESGDALCARLERVRPDGAPNPYRGLLAFEPEHRALFFGRGADARSVLERLQAERFVVVAGDSGAGKSSLCRAAVLPALADEGWQVRTVLPGPHPRAAIAAALAGDDVVLFIDQLEELLTVADPGEAAGVAELLAARLAGDGRFRLLASARGDFLGRLAGLPELGPRLGRALHLLGPLGARGLREAIVGPARALGVELEPATVDELVASSGSLPLLQFTLAELWEARDPRTRRVPADALARIGGVAGALGRHADQVMAALPPADREQAWRILVQLMTAEGTRAVRGRAELGDERGVVEKLVRARLVAVTGDDRVEVAHEALFTGWPRLVEWRRSHQEGARLRDQLAEAARQWDARGRPRGLLWRDEALEEYRAWRRRWPERPAGVEAAFGAASEADARRTRRVRAAALAVVVAGLSAGLVVLYRIDRLAERQKRTLLGEQGWQELAGDHAGRALPYLAEALREGDDSPAIRFLIAEAARPLEAKVASLGGIDAGLSGMAWSPDGARIVAGATDGTARLWDGGGRPVADLPPGPASGADCLAFTADGRLLATGGSAPARVFAAATGRLLVTLPDGSRARALAFDPAGARLASAGDGGVRVWDAATGAAIAELAGAAYAVAFSPDGRRLAAGLDDAVAVWDAATLAPVARLDAAGGPVFRVDFGGGRLHAASGRAVRVWDAALAPVATLAGHGGAVTAFAVAPDGNRVASASDDATVKVWDARTGDLLADLVGHTNAVRSVRFSPDGTRLLTTGDNTHRVWDAAGGAAQLVLESAAGSGQAPHAASGIVDAWFAPDGEHLVTADATELVLWRAGRAPLLRVLDPGGPVNAAVFAPDERRVAVAGNDGLAAILDLDGGPAVRLDAGHSRLWDIGWSRDGARLVVAGDRATAAIFDPTGARLTTLAGHAGTVNRAAFSPDGARVVTAGDDRTARVWDAATGRPLLTLAGHADRVMAATFSPDGARIATAGWDHALRLWDAADGRPLATLGPNPTQLLDVTFSPDGRRLACTGHDGEVLIWDLETGRRQLTLLGHTAAVATVAWSPDGALLATASDDGTARIWDAATAKMLGRRRADRPGSVMQAVWSRDGRRLLTAGAEGSVRLWDVHRDERPVAEVVDFVARRVPWRLVDGRLEQVPR